EQDRLERRRPPLRRLRGHPPGRRRPHHPKARQNRLNRAAPRCARSGSFPECKNNVKIAFILSGTADTRGYAFKQPPQLNDESVEPDLSSRHHPFYHDPCRPSPSPEGPAAAI